MKGKWFKVMAIAITAQLTYGSIAQAQDVTEMETGTVVISATRTEQMLEDVPQTMDVITAEDIVKMGATSLQQILARSPGILVTQTVGGNPSLSLRGSGLSDNDHSPLLLIDGRQPPFTESKKDVTGRYLRSIDPSNIERIEIIRGQAGVMYGADAVNGVINIITKKGRSRSGNVGITAGNSESVLSAFYDFGQIGNWDATLGASARKQMGQKEDYIGSNRDRYGDGYTSNGKGTTYSINSNIGYRFNQDHRVGISASYTEENPISYYKQNDVTTEETSYGNQMTTGSLVYDGQTENHKFGIDTGFIYTQQNAGSSSGYDITTITSNGQDTWFFNDYNSITFGYQYRLDTMNNHYAAGYIDRTSLGIFLQDEISLFDEKLYLIPAVRYDYNSDFADAVTFQLAGTYEFLPNQRLKASFGTSYSAPILTRTNGASRGGGFDGFTNSDGTKYTIGNPDLEALEGYAWEIAYEGEYKNLSGSIGYFNKVIDGRYVNMPVFGTVDDPSLYPTYIGDSYDPRNPFPGNRISTPVYVGNRTTTQGVDLELSYTFLEDFTVNFGYYWLDMREKGTPHRLGGYAEHTYTLGLDYYNPDWELSVGVWAKYMQNYGSTDDYFSSTYAKKDSYGSSYIYDYYDVNFSISKVWAERYTTTLAVYNLLKSSRNTQNDSFVNPTIVTLGLNIKF